MVHRRALPFELLLAWVVHAVGPAPGPRLTISPVGRPLLEQGAYRAFSANAKYVSAASAPAIAFMVRCRVSSAARQ